MCRPANVFRETACPGGHIGPPLRNDGSRSETNGNWCETDLANGAGRSPPPTGDRGRAVRPGRRGVVTPPCGGNAGSAQQRADVPKAWLPPTKFRAEIWGVSHGHRPLRPAGDEGRHAGSSCPTGGCGEPPRLPWVAAHSRASAPAVARKWAGNGAEITLKVSIYAGQSLSQPAADSSLYTREPLGTGDADCRVGPLGLLGMIRTVIARSEATRQSASPVPEGSLV